MHCLPTLLVPIEIGTVFCCMTYRVCILAADEEGSSLVITADWLAGSVFPWPA